MPERIVTDRGTAFTSRGFQKYCADNNVKHILAAVRTPRANGHAERTNRTILSMLLPSTTNDKRWDENIRNVQWCINTMKNSTTLCTPYELLYGFHPRDILKNRIVSSLHDSNYLSDEELRNLRTTAASRVNDQRAAAKLRYDGKYAKPKSFEEGDLVLAENEPPSTGCSRKLEPRYKGPLIVTKVLDKDRYVIEDLPQSKRSQKHYTSIYSTDKLKQWCALPPDDETDGDQESNSETGGGNEGVPIEQDSRL
ncbi:uncharacterized protein LOC118734544 [Rhagoletis pomonella]|uniref:uncharacterized protein LOC118734544 n=1 Tax=Rhagoletis pomonella TaxID=28610 RepID=UPI00177EC66D|nr:uncharacterized protein LOC118734544 [Rhagoletis pomonella]